MEKKISSEPELFGLVLTGGESRRMGQDKAFLRWSAGQPLVEKAYHTLDSCCHNVYISCRPDQVQSFGKFSCLQDLIPGIGPIGGLFTAMSYRLATWLVLAVDLPKIEQPVISTLMENRDCTADVTLFEGADGRQHPLCAIYEPSAYGVITQQVNTKHYAMMAMLSKIRCQVVKWIGDPMVFTNVNTIQAWRDLRPPE